VQPLPDFPLISGVDIDTAHQNKKTLMFDMNALLADAAGVTQPVARSAKTLDNFPLIPQKSKNRLDVSSELHLDIGFDTEYVYNPQTKQNDILSYQSYVVLPDGTGVPGILYPASAHKKDRLSLKNFLAKTLTPLLKNEQITEWPGSMTLYAHFLRADVASFSDFWSDHKILLKGIRSTVSSFKNRYGIDFDEVENRREKNSLITFDKRTSPPRCSNVTFTDTLLITPGGMGLAECGQLLGLPKLTVPAPYSISDMRQYLKGDRRGFEAYAVRDAEIAVRYALQVKSFCTESLMIERVPTTIGAMAVSRFLKTIDESGISSEICMGTRTVSKQCWNPETQGFRTVKTRQSIPARELYETFPINCYHGGRNECYMMGITPEREWYDYDLAGAYTTGLLDILQPDYDNIFHSRNPEDYCGHVMGFALVSFRFPDTVRYPCLPVRTDQYGLFFPLMGESWATAPEIALALFLGAEIEIQNGIIVPWRKSEPNDTEAAYPQAQQPSLFLPFVQQVRENRNRHDKGSLEEKFWKEIGNSLYGKLAQGLHAKTAFDTARGLNSPLPPSSVTQPFFAAHVTGFVRAVVGELMNALPPNTTVVSVTTDGFLTDASTENIDMSGPLSSRFQALCDIADPGSSMLTCKHQVRQLVAMKTRGQLTYKESEGFPIVHARAGVKPPADIPRDDYNHYMLGLYRNRAPGQKLRRGSLISTRDMWLNESDLVAVESDIRLNLEFDFKRQLIAPTMNDGHLLMYSLPWNDIAQALKQRQLFDDWRQAHCLKDEADWEDWCDFLYCRNVFTPLKLKVGQNRSDDVLVRLFLRALAQHQWGLTPDDRKRQTSVEIAAWLVEAGYSVTSSDVKNAGRAKLPPIIFGSLTSRMTRLMDHIMLKYPGFALPSVIL